MKRTVIFLLCLLLILCGGNHASHASEEVPILGKGDYFPLEQPVQLTAWVVNAVDNISIKNSYVLDWIREETNVDLQITKEFSGSGAKYKLSLSVATAQELPDILLCTRWTKAECALYGMQGLVLPLDAYLEDCENWNKLTEICGPEHVSDLMMPDGHIYCYGAVNECFHLTHQARMWLYKDWVDLLLDGRLPETTEEFYDYLCKVATMDPNGNGIADEIPLTGQIDEGWANDPFTFLSNAFVHNNTIYGSTNQTVASGCYLEDGEVRCNWVEEEYREALRYMNRLYSEGLLHSQVFSQNQQQMTAQVEATPIKKLCDTALAVCLYLFLLDSVVGGGWSGFVVPIVFFGELIVTGGYFLLFFHKRKRDFLPLFELILIGLVGTLLSLAGLKRLDWPMIVVGGVSLGLLLLSFLLFRKPLWLEIRKKFHT